MGILLEIFFSFLPSLSFHGSTCPPMKFPSPTASLLPGHLKGRCQSSDGLAVREAPGTFESMYYLRLIVVAETLCIL